MNNIENVPHDYQRPDWDNAGRVHDWKNYISESLINIWDSFTDEQKAAIAASAQDSADNEDWD